MAEAIDAVAEGFRALSEDRASVPLRTVLPLRSEGGSVLFMPAALRGADVATVKAVSVAPSNLARGLALVQAAVLVVDADTGVPRALLEGATLTALRTGAAGGVAAEALARPDSGVAAVFGAGVQARSQILALATALSGRLREVRVVGRDERRCRDLADWARERAELRAVDIRSASRARASWARDALEGADVVVTATSSAEPVFPGTALGDGVHVTAVGSFRPSMRELDRDTVRGARIVVDQRAAALAEAGELQGLRDEDVVEIGEVLAGQAAGRTSAAERTIFKSVGNAVQDLVVASRAYERARELGIGEDVAWP